MKATAGVLMLMAAAAGACVAQQPGPAELAVPRGAPIVLDGRLGETEWADALELPVAGGGRVRIKQDSSFVFLAIQGREEGFPTVCLGGPDVVRVIHASAALGDVSYHRTPAQRWLPLLPGFVWTMRDPALTPAALAQRAEFLRGQGWVGSTFRMGAGTERELQISHEFIGSGRPSIAVIWFGTATGSSGASSLLPGQPVGCSDRDLVYGTVPRALDFDPENWLRLRLSP